MNAWKPILITLFLFLSTSAQAELCVHFYDSNGVGGWFNPYTGSGCSSGDPRDYQTLRNGFTTGLTGAALVQVDQQNFQRALADYLARQSFGNGSGGNNNPFRSGQSIQYGNQFNGGQGFRSNQNSLSPFDLCRGVPIGSAQEAACLHQAAQLLISGQISGSPFAQNGNSFGGNSFGNGLGGINFGGQGNTYGGGNGIAGEGW
jgi:hypothetical protein